MKNQFICKKENETEINKSDSCCLDLEEVFINVRNAKSIVSCATGELETNNVCHDAIRALAFAEQILDKEIDLLDLVLNGR